MSSGQRVVQQWIVRVDGVDLGYVEPGQSVQIGRKPLRPLADEGVTRLEVKDSTRSMSKRHAMFTVEESGVASIRDLNSTNGSYVVRDNGDLMRIPVGTDFVLPSSPIRLQFGDVPLDFIRVERRIVAQPQVPDLFGYAVSENRQEPDAADMSVDDILDLRAGEPTSLFKADQVKTRAEELDAAQHQTFPPYSYDGGDVPLSVVPLSHEEENEQSRDLFADAGVDTGEISETSKSKGNNSAEHETSSAQSFMQKTAAKKDSSDTPSSTTDKVSSAAWQKNAWMPSANNPQSSTNTQSSSQTTVAAGSLSAVSDSSSAESTPGAASQPGAVTAGGVASTGKSADKSADNSIDKPGAVAAGAATNADESGAIACGMAKSIGATGSESLKMNGSEGEQQERLADNKPETSVETVSSEAASEKTTSAESASKSSSAESTDTSSQEQPNKGSHAVEQTHAQTQVQMNTPAQSQMQISTPVSAQTDVQASDAQVRSTQTNQVSGVQTGNVQTGNMPTGNTQADSASVEGRINEPSSATGEWTNKPSGTASEQTSESSVDSDSVDHSVSANPVSANPASADSAFQPFAESEKDQQNPQGGSPSESQTANSTETLWQERFTWQSSENTEAGTGNTVNAKVQGDADAPSASSSWYAGQQSAEQYGTGQYSTEPYFAEQQNTELHNTEQQNAEQRDAEQYAERYRNADSQNIGWQSSNQSADQPTVLSSVSSGSERYVFTPMDGGEDSEDTENADTDIDTNADNTGTEDGNAQYMAADANTGAADADNSRFARPTTDAASQDNYADSYADNYSPAFEPGSVFERVSKGEFNQSEPVIEVDGLTSDEAKRTTDFTVQFEMARHQQLLPFLAMNPSLYDDLYAWLAAQGNRDIDAALARNEGYQEYRKAVGK